MGPWLGLGAEPKQSECTTRRCSLNSTLDWPGVLSRCPQRAVGGRQSRRLHTSEDEDEIDRLLSVPYV
jgi:hypothetical protein